MKSYITLSGSQSNSLSGHHCVLVDELSEPCSFVIIKLPVRLFICACVSISKHMQKSVDIIRSQNSTLINNQRGIICRRKISKL